MKAKQKVRNLIIKFYLDVLNSDKISQQIYAMKNMSNTRSVQNYAQKKKK